MGEEAFVDDEEEPVPELNRLTNLIIAVCIEVHRLLGPGYLEAYYEEAVAREFKRRGITVSRQHPFQVIYKGDVIGEGRIDFVVEGKVALEIKSVESLHPLHTAQVISYLRATKLKLGLLINFNVRLLKDGIKRVAL
jgi:GxxExxY protein